ncbi:MAG: DNA damage-inducible protein D [Candidatus Gracilibacteria bacterium]|nr:DNA damage-inducible protein D [Candidatus Gracilibacteria bacterium]MDD4530513.1 DNA damage-inducible protein D [Candidatus Gracilibacteria bacterium]
MTDLIRMVQQSFEDIKITDETGFEFWSARDLMKTLGYVKWQKFERVIEKAKDSCKNSGQIIKDNFLSEDEFLPEPVKTSIKGGRPKENYFLTRYACYLIAQNGDPRKAEIAFAQTYFASQTRKQEIYEQRSEENKRLEARAKLKISEEKIEETVYNRGITLPVEFATFKNKKIETLYNMSVKALKAKRGIPENRALADFDSEVELKAKDFIYAMTDHNIKEKKIIGKQNLESELVSNAKETRKTMLKRGIVPEELKAQKDLKLIEKGRIQEAKKLENKGKKKLKSFI